MTLNELLDKANAGLEYYTLILVDRAMGEDGKFVEGTDVGYGLVNKITGIIEHTSVMLPGVMWQATHFESTLKSLLKDEDEVTADTETEGDVIPFDPVH